MTKQPRVSICIPTYRRQPDLEKCLQSIVTQRSFTTFVKEVIVMDNAPDDHARAVIAPFKKKFPKQIKYVLNKTNIGFERNILNLLKAVESEYLLVMTDDDTLPRNSLVKLKTIIAKHPEATFINAARNIYKDGVLTRVERAFESTQSIEVPAYQKLAIAFYDAYVLTGICLKTSALDLKGYQKFIGTMCPHMFVVGKAALQGEVFYSAEPLTNHTVANKVFWQNQPDYMMGGKLAMAQALSKKHPKFFDEVEKLVYADIPYLIYINLEQANQLFFFFRALWQKKLLSFKHVPYILHGATKTISLKLHHSVT